MTNKAIILLSGGLDSTTCLALAKQQKLETYALSFNYQQKHSVELTAAKKIAKHYAVNDHYIVDITLPNNQLSSLTNNNLTPPQYSANSDDTHIPNTYVPARNTLFLSYALSLAESIQANSIWIGCSVIDYSNYPDCRPEFIQSYQQLIDNAVPLGVNNQPIKLKAPLLNLSKAETIKLGLSLGVNYSMTISCYCATAEQPACGKCDSCVLRQKGFAEIT